MKRFFLLVLVIAVLASFCACNQPSADVSSIDTTPTTETTEPPAPKLLVGFARVNISPKITTPLRGFGDSSARMASTILEPLYATCTAVTGDNGVTALFFSVDLCRAIFADKVIPAISEGTGVPVENIFLSVTHTHAGVDVSNSGEAFYMNYMKELKAALPEVAIRAMHDRVPADMSYGTIATEGLTFTRHYQYTSDSGKVTYSFGGVDSVAYNGWAEHVTEPYEDMHVLHFDREEGKDVIVANWRAHPLLHSGGSRREVSADFVGGFRTAVELTQDCHFMYLQGAAGNMNSITALPREIRTEDSNVYGALLAGYVSDCLAQNMQAADGYAIKTLSDVVIGNGDLNLSAVSIGNSVSFVTAPCELFDSTTVYMEEKSPYSLSITMGYTNGHKSYLPTKNLFEYLPDYEWYEVGVTPHPEGTAEQLQEKFVEMLNKLVDQQPQQQTTDPVVAPIPEAEPLGELTMAWNIHRMDYAPGGKVDHSSRTPDEDGFYRVIFAVNGEQKSFRVKDKNLIEIIDFNDYTGLVLDGDLVTDVKVPREFTGELAANRSFVESVDGKTVHCNTAAADGVLFDLTLTDQTVIYDVSTKDENSGAKTELREGDQIFALRDLSGNIFCVYIINRANADDTTHENHCVCGGAAEGLHGECTPITDWIAWGDDPDEWAGLPTKAGNYYLTRDVYIPKRHEEDAGAKINICLNGKQIYCKQSMFFGVMGNLSICDCRYTCENGTYTFEGGLTTESSSDTGYAGAFYVYNGCELTLYGGNVSATDFWMRGGLIYIPTNSVVNIYNAVLNGAKVLKEGGAIYLTGGTLNIYGGVITGGNASLKGSGLYMKSGTLTISGAPKITGNNRTDACLAEGKTITIGEGGLKPGAEIGIMLDTGSGVFATNASKTDAQYFTATNGSKISWNSKTGELSINTPAG